MAGKILLISVNRYALPDPVFPLGLAHLNAALRRAGYETRWIDCQTEADALEQALQADPPHFVGISLRNIDDVLIGKQETFFGELTSLVEKIRRLVGCPVILGGSGFSIFPKELLERTAADFGVWGNGEASLISLLQALVTGDDYRSIPGLVFRKDGQIILNPPQAESSEIELEPPDWPVRLVKHYLQASGMLNLQTQRGCAFQCCYCTYPVIEGQRHRRRSPESVARELERVTRLGATYVFIVDSVFNSSPTHVAEICEAILARGVKMRWGCFLRPAGLTAELISLMHRAGLSHIEFGTDSFCDEVLTEYGKSFTFDDVLRASELAYAHKIDYCHFLICGGPGESPATLQNTFENSQRLPGTVIMAVVGMRIYPGTALCERARAEGVIDSHADLLAPKYYLARGLNQPAVFAQLREFARLSPSWVVGDPSPAYFSLAARLRQRGVMGPLWSYYAALQRLWPQNEAPGADSAGQRRISA